MTSTSSWWRTCAASMSGCGTPRSASPPHQSSPNKAGMSLGGGFERYAAPIRLPCPLVFAQHELLDLAGRGFWKRSELDRIRALVVREALAAERDDLLRGR